MQTGDGDVDAGEMQGGAVVGGPWQETPAAFTPL